LIESQVRIVSKAAQRVLQASAFLSFQFALTAAQLELSAEFIKRLVNGEEVDDLFIPEEAVEVKTYNMGDNIWW